MKRSIIVLGLLLLGSVSQALARDDVQDLKQAIGRISLADDSALSQASQLLQQVNAQDNPLLVAEAQSFVIKVALHHQNYASVESHCQALTALAKAHPAPQVQAHHARALLSLAKARFDQARYQDTLTLIEQRALPAIKQHAPLFLDNIYFRAARSALNLGELSRAKGYFSQAEQALKARGDEKRLARLLTHKASYLTLFWDIGPALSSLIEASQYQQAMKDQNGLFLSYRALGRLYAVIDDHETALAYFEKAQALNPPRPQARASLFYAMAQTYQQAHQPQKALAYATNATALMRQSSTHRDLISMLLMQADIEIQQHKFSSAWTRLQEVEQLAARLNLPALAERINLRLAHYHFARGQLTPALEYLQTSLAIDTQHKSLQSEKYRLASELYEAADMPAKALKYLKQLRLLEREKSRIKDEQRTQKQQNQINLLVEQKNTAVLKKQMLEKQHRMQQTQATQQRWWFGISFSMLLLFGLVYMKLTRNKRQALHDSRLAMDRMEQKNQFIANVAHELKNPLTVIQIHLEALRDGMVKEPKQAHHILEQRLSQLTHNIDELRQASLMSLGALTLSLRPVAFVPWLRQEIDAFTPLLLSKGLTLNDQLAVPEALSIDMDSERLSQVFANLIKNSLRYTHKPGEIMLSAHIDEDKLCVTLEDTPPAPPQDELMKLFEQGYRSESMLSLSNKGSGLGLYICKEIVRAHRAEIVASVSPLGGLRILITLPLTQKRN